MKIKSSLYKTKYYDKMHALEERSPLVIILIASLIGAITGIVGSLFQLSVAFVIEKKESLNSLLTTHTVFDYFTYFAIAALLGVFAYYLVQKFAPEASGSGIPEIEGALISKRPVRWMRVLPVKFFGGLGALGSGMLLGREGPTVQMGANLAEMTSDAFKIKNKFYRHAFIAAGAAAGITTAFNAPLAGILFVTEEMRAGFNYTISSLKAIFAGVITACIAYRLIIGVDPIFNFATIHAVPIHSLWIYLIFGVVIGLLSVLSNSAILNLRSYLKSFYAISKYRFLMVGGLLAGIFGLFSVLYSPFSGGGFELIPNLVSDHFPLKVIFAIFMVRLIGTVLCFSSGAPGGIFSPTLALGALMGVIFASLCRLLFPDYPLDFGAFALIGMAGLFAGTIRAPVTGIVLIVEMTQNYQLILPLIITCLIATFIAQTFNAKPLYTAILEKTLDDAEKAETIK